MKLPFPLYVAWRVLRSTSELITMPIWLPLLLIFWVASLFVMIGADWYTRIKEDWR